MEESQMHGPSIVFTNCASALGFIKALSLLVFQCILNTINLNYFFIDGKAKIESISR